MNDRHLIIVDCESSGLRAEDIAVEVAWLDLTSGERGSFVPQHDRQWVLNFGEERALEINGYRERLVDAEQDDGAQALALYELLDGNTLAGSNPTADAGWLEHLWATNIDLVDMKRPNWCRPWHHRMWDLSPYAAGLLGLDYLPGLWDVCNLLGVPQEGEVHTAAAGVETTVACFKALFAKARVQL